MLEYFYNGSEDSLAPLTRKAINGGSVDPERAYRNFKAFAEDPYGKTAGNGTRGLVWEKCIYDFLVHHGVEKSEIIRQVNITGKIDRNTKKPRAEIDFLCRNICLHAKTSIRERWGQVALAAYYLEIQLRFGSTIPNFDRKNIPWHYLIIFSEKKNWTLDQAKEHAAHIQELFVSGQSRVISARDTEGMLELIGRLK